MLNIVLYEPEIPENTGNIGRTCMASGARLHLIEPLGFRINAKAIKRAGLDYWDDLDVKTYINFEEFCGVNGINNDKRIYMVTTKARQRYTDVAYHEGDFLMFGKESAGLPEEILVAHEADCIRIPMMEKARSLNLSNAVAIVMYEGLRQIQFPGMCCSGQLHRLKWNHNLI